MNRFGRALATVILILLIALSTPSAASVQDRVLIGAYDPAHLNGLVFIANDQNVFGLRLLIYRPGAMIEETPRVFDFGPRAPNGAYASVGWKTQFDDKNPIILQWSRLSNNTVIGQLSAPPSVRVAMEVYRPWSETDGVQSQMTFLAQADRRTILGEQVQNQKNLTSLRRFFLRVDRNGDGAASYDETAAMRSMLLKEGHAQQTRQSERPGLFQHAALSFDLSQNSSLGFVAMVGDNFDAMESEANKLLQKPITDLLNQAEKRYGSARSFSDGALGDSLEAITRAVNWNRFYYPEKQLEYVVMQRLPRLQPDADAGQTVRGTVLSWDTFLMATMTAMIDAGSATGSIRAVLEGQLPDGRVPLRQHLLGKPRHEPAILAGRSMPPLGALCMWKVYLQTYDLALLAWAYPRLLLWNDWWLTNRGDGQPWRDGNGDGLLEWGFDAELEQGALGARTLPGSIKLKLAFSESGLDDRPQWSDGDENRNNPPDSAKRQNDEVKYNDKTHTLELSPVALNALYALDTEILMNIARELGLKTDADKLSARYERLRNSINNRLWSEEDGMYLNRHWDGRLSRRLSLENFYPLIAGVADEERAKRMVKTLRDTKKFWGEYLPPFISRDDPAFTAKAPARGAIWSVSNYLLYIGLRRYGFHDEASEVAGKSTALARLSWERSGKFHDQYSSLDGRPLEASNETQRASFAGLMFWPGIEELISADPWTGLAFGSLSVKGESRIERASFSGASFDVILGPKRTVVRRGGNVEVECDAPVQLRSYRSNDHTLGFAIATREQVRVQVKAVEGRKITVSVDDRVLGSTSPGAAASFKVPEGNHKVFIVK